MSLTIRPGEVIGIIGPPGSGKSTLAKLIQRLYLPSERQILLDGGDMSHADPGWLRRHIGVVLQENILFKFNRTIHDHIAFSNPAMHRAEVIALRGSLAPMNLSPSFRKAMTRQLKSAVPTSQAGQRQRIAIARALALNPPILIFDEATSAFDCESERIIQANMNTSFIIGPRSSPPIGSQPCGLANGFMASSMGALPRQDRTTSY